MDGFKKFILRGNVIDLAVGVVIGAAFGAVVNGFVRAFLTPLVGLAAGAAGDFSTKGFTVGSGKHALVFPYGVFVQALISFALIATGVYFLVVLPINRFMERHRTAQPDSAPETRTCPECLSSIPVAARRCAFCTCVVPAVA